MRYIPYCNNSMAWDIDNLLCKFHITITYDICNSTDILCIILWLSSYPWVAPVNGYMEINTWMNEWMNFRGSTKGSGTKDSKWLSCNSWPVPTSGCPSYRRWNFLWLQPPLPRLGAHCCPLCPGVSTNCPVTRNIQLYSQKQGF